MRRAARQFTIGLALLVVFVVLMRSGDPSLAIALPVYLAGCTFVVTAIVSSVTARS